MVAQDAAETSLRESRLDGVTTASGPAQPALDRLVDWTTGDGPALCALLGDVGMGKTTTAKLFTQRLLELRRDRTRVPLPLLFDLRDVRIGELTGSMTLDRILDGMLDATRPPDVPSSRLDAAAVRSRLARGDAVVVFDGLDEVLVHLSPHDQKLFTRQLWRVAEGGARMLVTCRTQYFRTVRDEIGCFTGEDRQGLRGDHYLALLMQPFREEQVREYLQSNVDRDGDWVDGFLETVAAVHDLTDLSHRPLTLRLIADQVEFIETAKLQGRQVRSVDLYGEVVDRWLSRDGGKHTLTPEHKQLLMEEIAAGLWRSGRSSWSAGEVDDWLLALLNRRPDLQLHYRERVPDLWKADFRTATFLARDRDDDTFAFGHRSLFEYFLARYLFRTLIEIGTSPEPDTSALAMAVPSTETLEFLGQSIAGASGSAQTTALEGLTRLRDVYTREASELALVYAVHAFTHGYPHEEMSGAQLGGAKLHDLAVGGPYTPVFSMAGADLAGADLTEAQLHAVDLSGADLSGADLSGAELHRCRLDSARTTAARMIGAILRRCTLTDVHLNDIEAHRTQILLCSPAPPASTGLLVAPATTEQIVDGPVRLLSPHTGHISVASWSPDGARFITGGFGGARIWDAAAVEIVTTLGAQEGDVTAVAWSPDGSRILTGGKDGVRAWAASTATVLWHAADHRGAVRTVGWSPDGSSALTGAGDGTRLRDAATGEILSRHDLDTNVVAWSPDGEAVLTGGEDGVWTWDPTLTIRYQLTGSDGEAVATIAWSPDSSYVITASVDSVGRILDTGTGACLHEFSDVQAVAWSSDGRHILGWGSSHGRLWRWDANRATVVGSIPGPAGYVSTVAWAPTGDRLIAVGNNGVWSWQGQGHRYTGHRPSQRSWRAGLAWSSCGTRVLVSVGDGDRGDLAILDVDRGGVRRHAVTFPTPTLPIWSPDSTRFACSDINGVLSVRDSDTGEVVFNMTDDTGQMNCLAWSPDGTRIALGYDDISIRNARTGEQVQHIANPRHRLNEVAWSPDGTQILAAGTGGAQVWDVALGTVRHTADHISAVFAVGWSPDGAEFVLGGQDGTIRVHKTATGQERLRISGHVGIAHTVAWSGDGRWIVSGDDGSVRIHDAITGILRHRLTGYTDWVSAVAFSPDSTRLASASLDGTIRIIDVATGRPTGIWYAMLPNEETAVFDTRTDTLVGASRGAWRWLGWNTMRDGSITRLPAETFGPLPPLPGPPSAGPSATGK